MQDCVRAGLVRSIGVSNFNVQLLHEISSQSAIPPAVNQVESHPYLSQPGLLAYCEKRNVQMMAYSPLGSPGTVGAAEPRLFDDHVIRDISAQHNRTTAQVCLRWNLQRGVGVIPKSANVERIQQNIDLQFDLTAEDMARMNGLDRHHRFLRPQEWGGFAHIAAFD
eukprot:c7804_g1_i2.p1 GENE.c7804_g1_i2~~c7804_g1_i2.p1  ORF type:complete len:166 (-),score=24.17 c7804_g1_i2:78-575(-)